MNKKYEAEELISRYHQGTASPEERLLVEQWFLIDLEQSHILPDAEAVKKADQKISSNLQAHIQEQATDKKIYKLWPRIAATRTIAAAAILLIIGLSIFFYINSSHQPAPLQNGVILGLASNDIKSGGNKAYLILSNGKRVSLTDAANGELAKETGAEITKTDDGQVVYTPRANYSNALNTIETPKGGQYQVRLPDGSKVWLNAASRLIYPVTFIGRGQREVSLDGEAYFEISKNKLQPFVVKSKNQEVTVLGTHFNINSYADEGSVKTTLLEGSVKINDAVLKPGEQSTLAEGKITIKDVDVSLTIAWKNGLFAYKNAPLETVMQQIARWYDVDIIYTNPQTKLQTFSGTVSRYDDVSKILKAIEYTGSVKFKMEGRKIIAN